MPQGDFVRDQPVRVFFEWRPANEAQPPAGSRRGQEIGKGSDRIRKEHDAEARGYQVEPVGLEMVHLRIGLQ